jgi:hypothetical protein
MTLDSLVSLATKRKLTRGHVEAFCAEQGISVASWLVVHAHLVGSRFLLGTLTWNEGSSAFNSVWPAVATDNELTAFAFNVYLAFEDAEVLDPEAARVAFTRTRLLQLRLLPDEYHPNA